MPSVFATSSPTASGTKSILDFVTLPMTLQTGQMLSHYRVVEKIGAGGMGEVWKALDTTLDREVAIKVLPEQFTQDPQRLARFDEAIRPPWCPVQIGRQ